MRTLKISLYAIDPELSYAWKNEFDDCENVVVKNESIFETDAEAIVSPANSFGYMDGGLDLKLSERFGWELERRVRDHILEHRHGELLVGEAIVVPTGDDEIRWLISAPTMRVPMDVSKTANAHLAFRAILLAAGKAQLRSIACSGLGTGEGRMSATQCAKQMRYAYDVVFDNARVTKGGLAGAVRNHMTLLELETDF